MTPVNIKDCSIPYLEGWNANRMSRHEQGANPYEDGTDEDALFKDGYRNVMRVNEDELDTACAEMFGDEEKE